MRFLVLFVSLSLTLLAGSPPEDKPAADGASTIKDQPFKVKTLSPISASVNKKGDRFSVLVLEPASYKNAEIEGEVLKAKASGKVSGKSELLFGFDKLILSDGSEMPINADLAGVSNSKGVSGVDEEGRVIGASSKKKDIARTAALTGVGALIGGLAGGGKGAVAGAAIGAGIGLTIAFNTKGPDIRFESGSVFDLKVTQKGDPVKPAENK